MVSFPPLMPSVEWWADFFKCHATGIPVDEAVMLANEKIPSSRDFARFNLKETNGEVITLSLAVEGGGRQLRTFNRIEGLTLSEHGEWRRNHMRAIDACLGKRPYSSYLFPKLSEVYPDKNLTTLKEFNTAIFRILYSFILGQCSDYDFSLFYKNEILKERGKEISGNFHPKMSCLEVVASYGKESLLGFLAINL